LLQPAPSAAMPAIASVIARANLIENPPFAPGYVSRGAYREGARQVKP
jgi:hypothetical protein